MLTWSYSESDELWQHDNFETVEDCIEDAKENYKMQSGEQIAIGTVYPYTVSVDVETMLEQIEENAYEECAEAAESWVISSRKHFGKEMDDLQDKVTELVNTYLEKIGEKPTLSKVDNIYTVVID